MTPFVHVLIVIALYFPVRFGRDDCRRAAIIQLLKQSVTIESLVGQQSAKGHAIDEGCNPFHVMGLPGQQ